MSNIRPLPYPSDLTLAGLMDLVTALPHLADSRRRETLSAIRTVARVLKAEPHMVPASPDELRGQLNKALPLAVGVSASRFSNAKSLLRGALAFWNPSVIPARSKASLLPGWAALLSQSEAEPFRRGLARFSKYCSTLWIEPERVTQAIYDKFYDDLTANSLIRSPRETQQVAGHAWNRAAAAVPGWPVVTVQIRSFRKNASLPWSAFPASLKQDLDAYLTPRSTDVFDLDDTGPSLRPATIKGKELQLRQFATAVVGAGHEAASLSSLADLVTVDTAKLGLQALHSRAGDKMTSRNYGVACELLNVARHWTKADPATVSALKIFSKKLMPKRDGMVAKNRIRLKQFDDPAQLLAMLDAPETLMREACRPKTVTAAEARIAQMAVYVAIALVAPVRSKNLSELELGRTLRLSGSADSHITIDRSEVKNDVSLDIPLPANVVRLIKLYLERFHALLAPPGSRMLFPSKSVAHKHASVLSHQMTTCMARRFGLVMNTHLFRHLAALMYLRANPGHYGVVKLLLGHKNIQTTLDAYTGTEATAAFHFLDQAIQQLRVQPGVLSRPAPSVRVGR